MKFIYFFAVAFIWMLSGTSVDSQVHPVGNFGGFGRPGRPGRPIGPVVPPFRPGPIGPIRPPVIRPVCPIACITLYAPVCGFNGFCYRIFSNSCLLNAANVCEHRGRFREVPFHHCRRHSFLNNFRC